MKKFKKNTSKDSMTQETSFSKLVKYSLAYTVIFYTVSFLVLLISSFFLYRSSNPDQYIKLLCIGVFGFSTILCGFLASKKLQQKFIALGLILGFTISISFFLISIICHGITNQQLQLLSTPILTVLGSAIGRKRENRSRHKHRRKH